MLLVNCPNCLQRIEIIELCCCIFRCGVYKENLIQINPHLEKDKCLQLVKDNQIYGCGAAFKIIVLDNNELKTEVCDYI